VDRRAFVLGAPTGLAVIFAAPAIARARVQGDYTYAWSQVWQAAVRLVRIDLQCPISDRDESIGYVMFDYPDGGRAHPGSVELVRNVVDGNERVRVVVQVPSMPSWVERMILDRLTRKLRDDFGEPPRQARQRPTEPAEPPDEAPEGDEDEGEGEGSD
jgi:hypothetical protein